jgi:hypothetical protein
MTANLLGLKQSENGKIMAEKGVGNCKIRKARAGPSSQRRGYYLSGHEDDVLGSSL